MGSKRNVNMSATTDTITVLNEDAATESQVVGSEATTSTDATTVGESATPAPVAKKAKGPRRSSKYSSNRSQVDKTRNYDPFAAVELVKRLSYSSFPGTITADLVVKDPGDQATLQFPHSTGKVVRVAIADDALIADIEAGKIEFDVLLSTPAFMPKLSKLARVLGPKGLMPNPKTGTLTPNPEVAQKELSKGSVTIKTERKQPVAHVVLGTTEMDTKALVENVQSLQTALRGKLQKMTLSATMSPSVKVTVE